MAMTVGELNVEIGARLDRLDRALNEMQGKMENSAKKSESLWSEASNNIAKFIAGAFSVAALAQFAKHAIKVRGEFERFGAVLSNTLGSEQGALGVLAQIQSFAAATPFSVRELTGAFVKLANQGFQPSREELRKLGDLASSTGKTFDQLAEAILDAQVGEFERLKEFGIRAADAGNQVIFTFKGVETAVDKNSQAIQEYMLSLGDLEGVTGSMEKISGTLEGSLSNLGDAFDNLALAVSNTDGVMNTAISKLSNYVQVVAESIKRGYLMTFAELEESQQRIADIVDSSMARINDSVNSGAESWENWSTRMEQSIKKANNQLENEELSAKQKGLIYEQIQAYRQLLAAILAVKKEQGAGGPGETRPREEIITLQPKGIPDLRQTLGNIIEPVKELNLQWAITDTIVGNIANGFFNLFNAAVKGTQSLIQALGDLIKQLIATVAQAAILAALMAAFGFGSFKKLFGQALGFGFELKPRASGGPVNFGQAYLVGERGPELFMPGRSGSIMPNNKLGMMGATVAVGGRLLGQDILISNARSQQGLSRQTGR